MLILITGGSRSGKSTFALELAERFTGPRAFLATAQALDEEMERRIAAHRRSRPPGWRLVEEPMDVPAALTRALRQSAVVIVDCVTLWVTNLMLADDRFGEEVAADSARALVGAAEEAGAGRAVIVVTNEVGCGVVPETALGRRFRDCAGRANQVIARGAAEVYLMTSGIPMRIKPREQGRTDG